MDHPSSTDRPDGATPARSFYDRWARLYDVISRSTPGIGGVRERVADACRLEAGETVVELGCGTGANLPYLQSAVGERGTVVGIDVARGVLDRAERVVGQRETVHLVRGDATRPPVPDGSVDAVVATFVVGMLSDPAAAVDRWCDLVRPGGRVVLANAASSERWYAPAVNPFFDAIVRLSTPPTAQLRYETDQRARLDRRVRQAHDRLRSNASATVRADSHFGVVRLTGGVID
ncbi:class I SAM-dependent methyltransferase [Halovivax limisalsi]|uniref:class I SAM-dependent methyltransferase n=1 Tax=Halovivax limisalsi TaxID=1453760 RepID=UPI001FFDA540|nr:methyltransferase domain-containing protein [Halovivax limisalsi]